MSIPKIIEYTRQPLPTTLQVSIEPEEWVDKSYVLTTTGQQFFEVGNTYTYIVFPDGGIKSNVDLYDQCGIYVNEITETDVLTFRTATVPTSPILINILKIVPTYLGQY